MKPHLAHINNTLIKKQLAAAAGKSSYSKYWDKIEALRKQGVADELILAELEGERERIVADAREGDDPFFQQGVHNAKVSCLSAIELIISELKGDTNG